MDTAKIFENGRSQAVRLPKQYRLMGKEAYISKVGEAIVLLPKSEKWDLLLASFDLFSDDFFSERNQPELDKRENLFK